MERRRRAAPLHTMSGANAYADRLYRLPDQLDTALGERNPDLHNPARAARARACYAGACAALAGRAIALRRGWGPASASPGGRQTFASTPLDTVVLRRAHDLRGHDRGGGSMGALARPA